MAVGALLLAVCSLAVPLALSSPAPAISCDSRFWGPIKASSIIGRVVMLLWHDSHPDFHSF